MKILLVEDDPILNQNINDALRKENHIVERIYDGILADEIIKKEVFDCIILDIELPRKNGYDICKTLRNFNIITPVIMLTAFSDLDHKVKGFNCGADDYLTKPFYMKELLMRIDALIRRLYEPNKSNHTAPKIIAAGDLNINDSNKTVTRLGKEIVLTPREFQILRRLCLTPGEIVTKKNLIAEIWENPIEANTNTVEVYINHLRKKIDKPFKSNHIKTRIGYGYYFEE